MRSYHHLHMPVLRSRDHINRRLAGLLPHHTAFVLLDVFRPESSEEGNVLALRAAAADAPRHVQVVMPCGPCHAVMLLAATPKYTGQALDYALALAGGDFVVLQDGHPPDADAVDFWARRLGVDLGADGVFDRTPGFVRYAAALGLP